jgi:WD40 repeat protein
MSPDNRIAAGSLEGTIEVWDERREKSLTLSGHAGAVHVAFSPDGAALLSSGQQDATVRVWNAHSGQELFRSRALPVAPRLVSYGIDGSEIFAAQPDGSVVSWDVSTWKERNRGTLREARDNLDPHRLGFSNNGGFLAGFFSGSVGSPEMRIFDLELGRVSESFFREQVLDSISALVPSSDGNLIAAGYFEGELDVLHYHSGKQVPVPDAHRGRVQSLAISPANDRIVTGSDDGTIKVWDTVSGTETLSLDAHPLGVTCVALRPDGRTLLPGGRDGSIKIWQAGHDTPSGRD